MTQETYKHAAVGKLAQNADFQNRVRSDNGIPWGAVQGKLADFLSEAISQDREERSQWVYEQGLVKHGLDKILGESGWRSESREAKRSAPRPVKWIIATAQAKPRDAGEPALPADWPPDDEFGPPPDDAIF